MDWINLIGSLGFPIIACICLGWYVKYSQDNFREELKEIRKEYSDEVNKVTEALNNNTMAINTLINKFSDDSD